VAGFFLVGRRYASIMTRTLSSPEFDAAGGAAQADTPCLGRVHAKQGRQGRLQGEGGGRPHHPEKSH